MAAVGALLISSGFALMATPTTASAVPTHHVTLKDWVCKYVGTPGVDEHLKNGNDGLIWVSTHATQGTWFNDAHGRSFVLLKNAPHWPKPDSSRCPPGDTGKQIEVTISFFDPTCENENTASFEVNGDTEHVTISSVPEESTPGEEITVTVTADKGFYFDGHKKTYTRSHTYGEVEDCNLYDATAVPSFTDPSCENQNTAVADVTGEHMTWVVTGGLVEPSAFVEITATADPGHMFPADELSEVPTQTKVFTYTFGPVEVGCTVVEPPVVPDVPTFVEPTCTAAPSVALPDGTVLPLGSTTVDPLVYEVAGDLVSGGAVTVDVTAIDPATIDTEAVVHWTHTFTTPTGCTSVLAPTEETTTPTVVEAGLAGGSNGSDGQGIALVATGLALLAASGALYARKGGTVRS